MSPPLWDEAEGAEAELVKSLDQVGWEDRPLLFIDHVRVLFAEEFNTFL